MAAIDFDANDVDPAKGFDPLPAGKYKAVIVASEEKETKKQDGSYLQLTFEVIEGEFQGRKVWARLNLNNKNQTAVDIARGELSAICRAVGVMRLRDSEQLHDLPLLITVSAKKDGDGEVRNDIRKYEPAGPAAPPAKPTAGSTPPWKKPGGGSGQKAA